MPRGGFTDATAPFFQARRPTVITPALAEAGICRISGRAGAPPRGPRPPGRGAARAARVRRPSRVRGRRPRDRAEPHRGRPPCRVRPPTPPGATGPTPHLCRLAEHLLRERERRHPLAHPVQHARARVLLRGFGRVPVHEHLLGRVRDGAGEHVRMPAHHLLGQAARDVVDVERIVGVARGDLGVEQHLPQEVAELLAEIGARSVLHGVDELRALLHEVRHQVVVVDLLRPHAAVPHRAHRLGGLAEGIRAGGADLRRRGRETGCGRRRGVVHGHVMRLSSGVRWWGSFSAGAAPSRR